MYKILLLISILLSTSFSQKIFEPGVKPIKGVYFSFSEFINNKPSFKNEDIFLVNGKKLCIYKNNKTKKVKGDIWGFSDGSTVFIHYGINYVGLTLNTLYSSFTIRKELPQTQTTGFLGGSTMKSKPFVDDSFHESTEYRNKYFTVDMASGEIFRLTDSKIIEIISSDNDLLKKFNETKKYDGIQINVLNEFQNKKN